MNLKQKLDRVEKLASASKLGRLFSSPAKYIDAILFRELKYKKTRSPKEVTVETFFDETMHILLPASTDIYLTGGKTHYSEVRLARFIIRHLKEGDTFVDVGAHYGYFSMLAKKIVGLTGSVHSFEASPKTHAVLQKNAATLDIHTYNNAVSDVKESLVFYEFPNQYSEYNTLQVDQFKNEKWYADHKPNEVEIQSVVLSSFLSENNVLPTMIKIDVEGAELKVINGLQKYISTHKPIIVMEYLCDDRGNDEHKTAEYLLSDLGFTPHIITKEGMLQAISSPAKYINENKMESDNIVFVNNGHTT